MTMLPTSFDYAIYLVIGYDLVSVISLIISVMIIRYYTTKPPGNQTILDLLGIDTFVSSISFTVFSFFMNNFWHIFGQVNLLYGKIHHGLSSFFLGWMVCNVQGYIIINAIMIFKADIVEEIDDVKLRMIARICILIYTLVGKGIDAMRPQQPFGLLYMTGEDVTK